MRHAMVSMAWFAGLWVLAGCAGSGQVIPIHIHPLETGLEKSAPAGLRVAVKPFEDGRSHTTHLGQRSHLWGGVTYFNVPGDGPGDAVAKALVEHLNRKGWQAEMAKADGAAADVIFDGTILDLNANAKSGVGSTKITTDMKVGLQAQNAKDGSAVRMTLTGSGSDRVFWFEPEDVQKLVNDVMTDSFEKVLKDTKIENGTLRLK